MFLKHKSTDKLMQVVELQDLMNPMHEQVVMRLHYGEEAQDPETVDKQALRFPSGEALPRAWTDPHYRDEEVEAAHHDRSGG
ncbi:MAG: acetyltransferase [Lamprobacter sp.]|uniref:acetyltransferase n=1 Tax=Lamprobacter sp. TaxID=3100796 RepID=UPI002B261C45|nr:acetyltransferase [Lamprobacter sp.]MEA3641211.1 acetyltransferase [Lamprobacter sp.]